MTGRSVALAVVKPKGGLTVKEQLCVAGIYIGSIMGSVAFMEHKQRKYHRTNMEYLKAASSTESF